MLLFVIALAALAIAIGLTAAAITNRRSRTGRPTRRMTVAERGEDVGLDFDDEHRDRKLADNVDIPVVLTYRTPDGRVSTRALLIDGVYGQTLGHPTYIRGLDSQSREVRTFRTDRILTLGVGDAEVRENIPYILGLMVRDKAGLPELLPPQSVHLDRPVRLTVRGVNGQPIDMTGRLCELELRYERQGKVWQGVLIKDPAPGRRAGRTTVQWGSPRFPRNLVLEAYDGETGEVIESVDDWLRGLAANS